MEYNKEWEYGTPVDCDCENNFIHIDCGCKSKEVCDCENILLEISKLKTQDIVLEREIDVISGVVDTKLDASAYTPVDMSDYYTKSEVDSKIPSLDSYATEDYVNTQISSQTSDFVTGEQLSSYTYDKATINEKIAGGGIFDPTQYYNTAQTQSLLDDKADLSAFTAHTSDTTVHVTSAEKSTWNSKANVWCGDSQSWSQISGGTLDNNTIYMVY